MESNQLVYHRQLVETGRICSARLHNPTVLYFLELLDQKLNIRGDGAVMRIEAIYAGDWERVEFLEQMMLKPLSKQVYFLTGKLLRLLKKEKK